ncbi:unnamed protein product [Malus baccata var. baccata]
MCWATLHRNSQNHSFALFKPDPTDRIWRHLVILCLGVVVVDVVRGMVVRRVDGLQVERELTGGVPGGQSGVWVRDYREIRLLIVPNGFLLPNNQVNIKVYVDLRVGDVIRFGLSFLFLLFWLKCLCGYI